MLRGESFQCFPPFHSKTDLLNLRQPVPFKLLSACVNSGGDIDAVSLQIERMVADFTW